MAGGIQDLVFPDDANNEIDALLAGLGYDAESLRGAEQFSKLAIRPSSMCALVAAFVPAGLRPTDLSSRMLSCCFHASR